MTPGSDPLYLGDSRIAFYVGREHKGWPQSPLANIFNGTKAQSLDKYSEWLDDVVRQGQSAAYDLLSRIGTAHLLGVAILMEYDATKRPSSLSGTYSHIEIMRDKVLYLTDFNQPVIVERIVNR